MLRENKAFTGILTKVQSRAKDEQILMDFNIRHVEEGDNQIFLSSYASKCNQDNVDYYFRYPVSWKSINIEANYKFRMEFDEVEFEASLIAIKVSRSFKVGMETFTYNLQFEKEIEADSDLLFTTYLNQKEETEDGKKRLIEYSVYLHPLEEGMVP